MQKDSPSILTTNKNIAIGVDLSPALPATMKAIGFYDFGSADVLKAIEVPLPTLTADGVLIKVAAASVNPADWRIRSGQFKNFMTKKRPFVPGADVAGVVVAVGANVTTFQPGEPVYALLPTIAGGGYAEYAVADEKTVAKLPGNIKLSDAAAIPLTALTALQALRDKAKLTPGTHILINGASGGVGTFAVQIAKVMGAKVTAVCSARNVELVKGLGADEVLDYTVQDITKSEARYDMVFDAANVHSFGKWRRILKPKGTFISVNPFAGNPVAQFLARLKGSQRIVSLFVKPNGSDLAQLSEWLKTGQLRPAVEKYYPYAEAAEAQRHNETGRVSGKLVLVVDAALAGK
jgi:NADPH:quinone reductase-like Zn-dependent oxidoreductase